MPEVVQEGWLKKRGEYIKDWRKRYFVLQDDGLFTGYKVKPSKDEIGDDDTPLNNFTVDGCQVMAVNRPKPFTFVVRGLQMTSVVERMFCVESDCEREVWVKAIETVRQKLSFGRETVDDPKVPDNFAKQGQVETNKGDKKVTFENFEFLKVLGRGTFGKVVLCREKSTRTLYAIKILKKEVVISRGEVEHTLSENKVLQTTKHPFIIGLKYSFTTQDRLCLVMEYVNGGELYVHLMKDRQFSEERSRFYGAEITSAIGYLHKRGIIYRDLKLENLLLDNDGHIKVADFGLCKELLDECNETKSEEVTTATFCGTPEYLAPELLAGDEYGLAVDWWGLGCVLYEMIVGRLPFYSQDQSVLFQQIVGEQLKFPLMISPSAKSILSGLLNKNPHSRLGGGPEDADEIMNHNFFQCIDWNQLEKKRLIPPFKPQVVSETDTRYFDSEFTGQSVELTPPETMFMDTIFESEEMEFTSFSYQNTASILDNK